jgi:hypothetical protein
MAFDVFREALTELGLHRYCCRRMVLTHVDLIDKLLNYNGRDFFCGLHATFHFFFSLSLSLNLNSAGAKARRPRPKINDPLLDLCLSLPDMNGWNVRFMTPPSPFLSIPHSSFYLFLFGCSTRYEQSFNEASASRLSRFKKTRQGRISVDESYSRLSIYEMTDAFPFTKIRVLCKSPLFR